MTVEELRDAKAGTLGELLLDRELSCVAFGGESWELRDLDFERESELGVGPDSFAFGDIDHFDTEGCLGDV